MNEFPFIIRVYGIYIDGARGLFVSDEIVKGEFVTKFPGGGLIYGEGTVDCLKREMMEETGLRFEITGHYYTTDFFLESAFHPARQIISIYYTMKPTDLFDLRIATDKFDFMKKKEGALSFRFIPLTDLSADEFSFPIDRYVVTRLINDVR
jgi:ADP-ribose pyrophosphatase YjhB (NUDIX family)